MSQKIYQAFEALLSKVLRQPIHHSQFQRFRDEIKRFNKGVEEVAEETVKVWIDKLQQAVVEGFRDTEERIANLESRLEELEGANSSNRRLSRPSNTDVPDRPENS